MYTARKLKNIAFGNAIEFVWCGTDSKIYAIKESNSVVKVLNKERERREEKTGRLSLLNVDA